MSGNEPDRQGSNLLQGNYSPLCGGMTRGLGGVSKNRRATGDRRKIIGRWHDLAARTGVIILESDDLAAVQRYIGLWNPYMETDLVPVLDDNEATAVGRQIIAANKA
jgi:hypothetical protein